MGFTDASPTAGGRSRPSAVACRMTAAFVALHLATIAPAAEPEPPPADALVMVVSDPLAAELSCPCVAGYAQRDYGVLADHLAAAIGHRVSVIHGDSIAAAVGGDAAPAHIVIGKRSVIVAEAAQAGRHLQPVAELTGLDGATTQRGLVVVHRDDPARAVADLAGHVIVLGPAECDEKHAAARKLLAHHAVAVPAECDVAPGCTEAADRVLAARREGGTPVAAIVSSYATPLLEGCGTVKKGDLRVIGETTDVPFITVFIDGGVDEGRRRAVLAALRDVADEPAVRLALESKAGFRILPEAVPDAGAWPGFRGPNRDAAVAWLPSALPDSPHVVWTTALFNEGVGGVAVAEGLVLVGDRDIANHGDVFHALDEQTGERLWTLDYPAEGNLDYGNSPRATPLVHDGHAYLLGAFGHLHCVRLDDGEIVWRRHLRDDFGATGELVWGVSSSPLVVDGKLIVNPGGPDASLVALDPATGDVVWSTPGEPAAYASFVVAQPGGVRQLVGYDAVSCGGWDITTGGRLWTLTPRTAGDFNVPTPLALGREALFFSENNGARSVDIGPDGKPTVAAAFARLNPDMHSPVACGGRIFGVHDGKVTCLDAETLEPVWVAKNRSLRGHASLITSPDRVLVCTEHGELVLLDAKADGLKILSRCRVLANDSSTLAHPAMSGRRLYIRGPDELVCLDLGVADTAPR